MRLDSLVRLINGLSESLQQDVEALSRLDLSSPHPASRKLGSGTPRHCAVSISINVYGMNAGHLFAYCSSAERTFRNRMV